MIGMSDRYEDPNTCHSSLSSEARYHSFLLQSLALIDHEDQHLSSLSDALEKRAQAVFSDFLSSTVFICEQSDDETRDRLLDIQPVVFARAAGFLARFCRLEENIWPNLMTQILRGYKDAETEIEPHEHDHPH